MTMPGRAFNLPPGVAPSIPGLGMEQDQMAKALFAAIIAAGRSTCNCQVCQLMKKVCDGMVNDLLKEEGSASD